MEAIEAIALLRDAGFQVRLNIYGYALKLMGDYVKDIEDTIVRLGLSGYVQCHGLATLPEIAKNNDIILSASLDESLPQTLLELMRLGLIGAGVLSGGDNESCTTSKPAF